MPLDNSHWQEFGAWLRRERRGADLTQAQVAKRAGIHEVQVARIEKGESGTKRETVMQLALAIGIDVGEALNKAGYALVDPDGPSFSHGVIVPPFPKKPKNVTEFLERLEEIGFEQFDFAADEETLAEFTPDDLQELLDRIAADVNLMIRRKKK
jgi:transcriptional regulator with XRE-family HTH domain